MRTKFALGAERLSLKAWLGVRTKFAPKGVAGCENKIRAKGVAGCENKIRA